MLDTGGILLYLALQLMHQLTSANFNLLYYVNHD